MIFFNEDAINQAIEIFDDSQYQERAISYINLKLICQIRQPQHKIQVVIPYAPKIKIDVDAYPIGDYDWEIIQIRRSE